MGKPVRGRNKFPFAAGGLMVNGANINGELFDKKLYIHKQRSYGVYDLVDINGKIYEFVKITYKDKNGYPLDYYDVDENLMTQIKFNTFYIKAQDERRKIYGFVTLYMYRYLKVHTGDVIYRTTQDPNLSGVRMNPNILTVNVGSKFTATASFIPYNYPMQSGKWTCNNDNVSIQAVGNNVIITGQKLGQSIVSFVPDANNTHTAHTIINVIEQNIPITELHAFFRHGGYHVFTHEFDVGQEFTIALAPYPISSSIPGTVKMEMSEYYENFFEYLGTDNNIDFKFKVKEWDYEKHGYSVWGSISFELFDNNQQLFKYDMWPIARKKSVAIDSPYFLPEKEYVNIGETVKLNIMNSTYYEYPGLVYKSKNPNVCTVDQNGVVTGVSKGTAVIGTIYNGIENYGYGACSIVVDDNFIYSVKIEPEEINTLQVGEVQKYHAVDAKTNKIINGTFKRKVFDKETNAKVESDGTVTALFSDESWYRYNIIELEFTPTDNKILKYGSNVKQIVIAGENNIVKSLYSGEEKIFVGVGDVWSFSVSQGAGTQYEGIDVVIEDPTIAELYTDWPMEHPTDNQTFDFKGLKRGSTKVTFVYRHVPSITFVGEVVVF